MWPVGAVSNMMRLKCEYSGELMNCTTLLMATASSTPGGSVSRSSPGTRGWRKGVGHWQRASAFFACLHSHAAGMLPLHVLVPQYPACCSMASLTFTL